MTIGELTEKFLAWNGRHRSLATLAFYLDQSRA
jgi:hypothetical protein